MKSGRPSSKYICDSDIRFTESRSEEAVIYRIKKEMSTYLYSYFYFVEGFTVELFCKKFELEVDGCR